MKDKGPPRESRGREVGDSTAITKPYPAGFSVRKTRGAFRLLSVNSNSNSTRAPAKQSWKSPEKARTKQSRS